MAIQITGAPLVALGKPGDVDTVQRNPLGMVIQGVDSFGAQAEFVYLKGIASTIVGSVVTYDASTGVTALIVADMSGQVAVALGLTVAATFGWYGITGTFNVDVVANSAAAAAGAKNPGRETTDGKVGDGRVAGDEIAQFYQRTATTAAAIVPCTINRPWVDNFLGA